MPKGKGTKLKILDMFKKSINLSTGIIANEMNTSVPSAVHHLKDLIRMNMIVKVSRGWYRYIGDGEQDNLLDIPKGQHPVKYYIGQRVFIQETFTGMLTGKSKIENMCVSVKSYIVEKDTIMYTFNELPNGFSVVQDAVYEKESDCAV